ncbi:TonB-linked SusC/RagA family outer membrane protein [Longimicrobium terrae]|uniref:TonB-linked SusC/RagA family outer membrane protein n=2 Tax=Longimicrobium terrae TaxID=1639882 RepID=A0A841H3V9_9BACT|nr:TonB-linked SusC/RagA family outer membrane protein [Longimicrobium terrae]
MMFSVRMRSILSLAAAALLLGAPVALSAQARTTISGSVRGPNGQPVSSARVVVSGTTTGALTDQSGAYRLAVTGATGTTITLRASAIGYGSQAATVTLNGAALTQNFQITEQALALDAVVVTGSPTGQATRREVPNSVSTIQTADVVDNNASINNVTAVLQSRVPGVQVMTQSGTEGTSPRVRIRGISSINAGSAPIYVIDGVRMNGASQTIFGVGGASQSASDAVHPSDIESIEVIKGPAASTLYGADAANGVISITTKKGRAGQQRVQVQSRVSYGEQEFHGRTFTNYTLCTKGRVDSAGFNIVNRTYPGCSGVTPGQFITADLLRQDPKALRTGHLRTYSLNATGGGERFGFFLSGNWDDNDGVTYNNEFSRISGRANFTVTPSDKLDANVNLGYSRTENQLPLSDNASLGLTRNANRATPGRLNPFGVSWLGLSPTEINAFDNSTEADRFLLSGIVRWQPFTWFQNRLAGGFDYNSRTSQEFYARDEIGLAQNPQCQAGRCPYGALQATGLRQQIRPLDRLYTVDYAGTISNDLPRDFSSTLTFGSQLISTRFGYIQGTSYGFAPGSVTLLGTGSTNTGNETYQDQRTIGFFAQETVGWRDRLFLTAGLRNDRNSAFGADQEYALYPKLGASYVISEEPFFNVPGVDQFRIRAAWGRAGNAPAPYSAEQTFVPNPVIINEAGAVVGQGFLANTYGNPNLTAEQGEEYELGFDGSLLNGRIALDFTYYNKTTNDALIPVPNPPSGGFAGSVNQNVGEINNRGTELTLSVLPIETRNFTWESRIAHATLKNELVSFGGVRSDPIISGFSVAGTGVILGEGRPLGTLFGTVPSRGANGEILRGAPTATYRRGPIIANDTVYYGGSLPTRTLSWDNSFRVFRNLRFGFQLDRQTGAYQLNLTRRTRTVGDLLVKEVLLTSESTAADTLVHDMLRTGGGGQYIESTDFVKLREISASYVVPTRFTQRFGTEGVVVSLSGRNLSTWTDYTGVDPEVNADNSDFLLAETNAVPPTRRITASITVRF